MWIFTYCAMEEQQTQTFLDLNRLLSTIQFTMELERDGSLPFLNTLLTKTGDGSIDIGEYRKTTHTDRYLQYSSQHQAHVKRRVASCLFHWARTVAVGEKNRREEEHMTEVMKINGYPDHIIGAAAKTRRGRQPEEKPKYMISFPYVSGVSEDLRRVCRRYHIRTVFTTISTLRQQLTKVKDLDPFLSRAGVVYRIPCSNCDNTHIEETNLKEHQANIRRGEIEKSAIAEHAWTEQYQPHGMRQQ